MDKILKFWHSCNPKEQLRKLAYPVFKQRLWSYYHTWRYINPITIIIKTQENEKWSYQRPLPPARLEVPDNNKKKQDEHTVATSSSDNRRLILRTIAWVAAWLRVDVRLQQVDNYRQSHLLWAALSCSRRPPTRTTSPRHALRCVMSRIRFVWFHILGSFPHARYKYFR